MKRMICLIGVALAFGGCSNPRKDVPGHLQPGNVHQVTSAATGIGSDRIRELGMVPLDGFVPATVPLVEAPQVASIWFFARHSRDGRSEREGHWVHTQLGQPRFYRDRAMNEGLVPLGRLNDVQIGSDGRPYVLTDRMMEGQLRRPMVSTQDAPILPWQPSGEERTRTTVIVDQTPQGGNRQMVQSTVTPSAQFMNPDGTPNAAAIDNMVNDINRRLQSSQSEQ